MTRVAIVADSEELRAELADALRASRAFEVVGSSEAADVLLTALSHPEHAAGHPERSEGSAFPEHATGHPERSEGSAVLAPTNREREILALLADGLGNKQIAARLGISANTVKTHVELLFERLGVSSRAEAVAVGVRRGLLHL